jgi:hypothetical protein
MKTKIEKYFSGETSKEEEQEIIQYFLSNNIDPELKKYQTYFQGLSHLKTHADFIIPKEDYENYTESAKNSIYYIKRVGIALAIAASFALLLLLFPFWNYNNNFVVINGIKYTDKNRMELALNTSLTNVKLDVKQMFVELDDDLLK